MKIVVLSASSHANSTLKDAAGGFGTVFTIGNSPFSRVLELAKRHMASVPNITLAYLDAILSEHGASVTILDRHARRGHMPADLVPADLYLISSSIVDCNTERRIGHEVRERFGAKVGYFGPFASAVPEFFGDAADFVVREEIENIAPALARGEIPTGVVSAGFVDDLDALPYPRWDQFDIEKFRYSIITPRGITLPMLGSRGCPNSCAYCPYLVNSKYRARSPENMIAEVRHLVDKYGAKGISFRDPNMNVDMDRARRFAEMLIEGNLDVRWSMEARTDRLDAGLVDILYRAGLRSIEFGVESVNEDLLHANSRRAVAREHQEFIIRHCQDLGIRVIANYMIGLPGDTVEGIRETIRYAKELNTWAVQFTMTTPYPGTQFYETVKDSIFERDWECFNGWTSVYHHPSISPEKLHRLRRFAYVSYHLRPRYVWRFLKLSLLYRFFFPEPGRAVSKSETESRA